MNYTEATATFPKIVEEGLFERDPIFWDPALGKVSKVERADRARVGLVKFAAPAGTIQVTAVIPVYPGPRMHFVVPPSDKPVAISAPAGWKVERIGEECGTLPPGWKATQIQSPTVSLLELKEFCYARTLIGEVDGLQNDAELIGETELRRLIAALRDMLRCHRFDVFAWLMQQGLAIPANLIADATHPTVGNQSPDRPVPVAPPAS